MRAWLLFVLLLALLGLVWSSGWRPPDRYNPWAPLDLRAEPGPFLAYKLGRLDDDPALCQATIARAGAVFAPLSDHEAPGGCGWTGAVKLSALEDASLVSPVVLTCRLAAALVLFDRQALQPTAQAAFGEPVRRIDHVGSYACRHVYHRDQAPLSRHARADALDITGFRLASGRRVGVEKGWDAPVDGAFLRHLQPAGCRYFGAFFGPDYNAAHRTHFHVQGSGYGACGQRR